MELSRGTLLTHGGKFRCDDAIAYTILRLALGLDTVGRDHRLVRTRDKAQIAAADTVFDAGARLVDFGFVGPGVVCVLVGSEESPSFA